MFMSDPDKYDVYRIAATAFVSGLLVNPPFSRWEEFAEYFLNICLERGIYMLVIAPNQPLYNSWYTKWFTNTENRPYCRIDLETPLAFQKGTRGQPAHLTPHTTSIFLLGLRGQNITLKNNSSGFIYPNVPWLRKIQMTNSLPETPYYASSFHIKDRLAVLQTAEDFRKTEDMPQELIEFEPPPLPVISSSTPEALDSIFSAFKRWNLPDWFSRGCHYTSRQQRKARRAIRTLGEQLEIFPKLPKGQKYWPDPSSVPPMCPVCFKTGHPATMCTKRILREDECIFASSYEKLLFHYITYIHVPYHPVRRPANESIIVWMEHEMTRIQRDAKHFRHSFVDWARSHTGNKFFQWKEAPTYNFSEVANAIDFWAAIAAPKFLLQRFINGFRAELTLPEICFEVKNRNSPEQIEELYELHTKPYLEDRKICFVPDWYPQVVFSRFLVEEPSKKRPILDCSPLTAFTLCSHFELPPARSHQHYMPRGYLFGIDAKGCFCNCVIRAQDRRYLCFFDEHTQRYCAYLHAAFGFAAGPEYADSTMSPIRNWMRHGFAAALWIDDMSFIWDKLDISSSELSYMLTMLLQLFSWIRIRLNKKCILVPRMELPFTGINMNALHCKVFVKVKKLREAWELIELILSSDSVKLVTLKRLLGKFHWCVGPARPRTLNTLQADINEHTRNLSRVYPIPMTSGNMSKILRTALKIPPYLRQLMHEVLRFIETRQFALSQPNPTSWYLVTDTGDRAAGGFGYTMATTTERFEFPLPRHL